MGSGGSLNQSGGKDVVWWLHWVLGNYSSHRTEVAPTSFTGHLATVGGHHHHHHHHNHVLWVQISYLSPRDLTREQSASKELPNHPILDIALMPFLPGTIKRKGQGSYFWEHPCRNRACSKTEKDRMCRTSTVQNRASMTVCYWVHQKSFYSWS
jgi:hypothetical protein